MSDAKLALVETADEAIDALGGTFAAAKLLGTTAQAVSNWRSEKFLPARRFFPFSRELEKVGRIAPLSLFGMLE